MINKVKKILGENNYLKIKQLYMKIFLNSTPQKEKYIKKKFKKELGYEIDFNKEPETFNQKIQFRKLYDNNPLYSICADKYRVREYVKEKIGEEYLIPLYLVTDKLTEEQWDKLPNSFVAKANHNSGPVQIVKDKSKVDKKKIIKELNNQLEIDYGIISMEKYYSDIPRKIIVEKLLIGKDNEIPEDYKFHCFKEKIIIQVDKNRYREHTQDFFDEYWNKLNLKCISENSKEEIKKPGVLLEAIAICKKLLEDFEYVRVDIYIIENKIYFGELTFAPWSGSVSFKPYEMDIKFGEYWESDLFLKVRREDVKKNN